MYLSNRVSQTNINNASMNSSNIDDIWDEPLAQQDGFEAPTRSKRPLFLVESDDDDDDQAPRRLARKPPPQQDIDIDALFQDVEEDDTTAFKPLPPALDIEAVRHRAEARHKQTLTPHEILPSSSPPHDTGDRREEGKIKEKDKGDQKKERRRPVQLNEGRLLGPSGFPQLIKDTKNFRIKGKGHEVHGFFLLYLSGSG
jgi:replication fork protection complex subunit Csm3/Swi3